MLILKYATNGTQFQKEAKEYVINMLGNKQKLHKKNCCQYSKFYAEYYDFDTLEEVKNCGFEFTKCKLCFKGVNTI